MIEMKAYLKAKGFSAHPFNTFDADREVNLKRFVVLPPYFESVFGIPEDPQPFLVLGMRGLGKTTLRCMLKDRIENDYADKVFAVDYNFFPFTKAKELKEVTLKDHLLEMNRVIFKEICNFIENHEEVRKKIKGAKKEAFFHLGEIYLRDEEKQKFYPLLLSSFEKLMRSWPKKKGRDFYLSENTQDLQVIEKGNFTLDRMKEILKLFGFITCYIFIDKLDETTRTNKEPELAGTLVGPLISSLEIVQRDFFAFKFFVPAESIPNLKKQGYRNDKIQNQLITWTEEKLFEVLKKRIMAFNKDGKLFGKLSSLCEEEIAPKIDEFVVKKAVFSPRNLLRFCNAIFSEHVEESREVEDKILKKTIGMALKKYEYSLKVDQFCADE